MRRFSKIDFFTVFFAAIIFIGGFIAAVSASLAHADDDPLEQEKALSREYVALMAAEPGAQTIASGVVYRPLYINEQGTQPTLKNTVKVVYQLWDREGALIDDGFGTDDVPAFELGRLITCWKIALPQMRTGSFAKITCPSDTAYGDGGAGEGLIKPGAALTFRVGLLGVEQGAVHGCKSTLLMSKVESCLLYSL